MNYYQDDYEWKWLFKNAVDWDTIISLYYPTFPTPEGFKTKEEVFNFLEEIVSTTGGWCGSSLYEKGSLLDREGAGKIVNGKTAPGEILSQIYSEVTELELWGLPFPQKYGGLALPLTLQLILCGQMARSCMSSSTQLSFFTSIGDMIYRYCDKETADRLVPQIAKGKISGSMCLTEPGCGSDLGMIKTSATPIEENEFLLNGTKCFITNGGGGLGFVLARIKGEEEGLAGLSMFLVEQDLGDGKNNFIVSKSEDKMGMHGSFTCEIVYENTKAILVGEKNRGFNLMLHLMNEARIAVGMQGLGTIEGSLDYAYKYACEREQFGKPIKDLPLLKRNLSDFNTEKEAIRAMLLDSISNFDIYAHLDLKKGQGKKLTKKEEKLFQNNSKWLRKKTPLVKYYACEKATEISQRAIQVLGGYGFMREYPVERYHRDSFGPLLYEGTSQIQALMALKDLIKVVIKAPASYIKYFIQSHPLLNLGKGATRKYKSTEYRFCKKFIQLIFKTLRPKDGGLFSLSSWTSEKSIDALMIHAETLTQALSYLETLRVLARHTQMDKSREDLFKRYYILVAPRFEQIYLDWKIRE